MTGLVLAAGKGSRMGQPKATLVVDGKPLAWTVARKLLAAGLSRVVVALRAPMPLPEGAEAFLVPDPDGEAIDTIRQAQAHIGGGPIVLLPVDCPEVRVETIRRLIEAYRAPWIKPTYRSKGGHPVIFDLSLAGAASLRDALQRVPGMRLDVDDPGILHNWNRPQDITHSRRSEG